MLFVERKPSVPLASFVQMLWLARDPEAHLQPRHERVLPNGRIQLLINLNADHLTDVDANAAQPHSLIVGVQSHYETISTADTANLIGIIFHPGGLRALLGHDACEFSDRSISLEDVLGRAAGELRCRLRELTLPHQQLGLLERWLITRALARNVQPCSLTAQVLDGIAQRRPVQDIVRETGLSHTLVSRRFREQAGVTPKIFDRIQRFQRAVRQLHRATSNLSWADLALDCGFYDQAHFSHEFRNFSGMSVSEYSAAERRWSNHVPV